MPSISLSPESQRFLMNHAEKFLIGSITAMVGAGGFVLYDSPKMACVLSIISLALAVFGILGDYYIRKVREPLERMLDLSRSMQVGLGRIARDLRNPAPPSVCGEESASAIERSSNQVGQEAPRPGSVIVEAHIRAAIAKIPDAPPLPNKTVVVVQVKPVSGRMSSLRSFEADLTEQRPNIVVEDPLKTLLDLYFQRREVQSIQVGVYVFTEAKLSSPPPVQVFNVRFYDEVACTKGMNSCLDKTGVELRLKNSPLFQALLPELDEILASCPIEQVRE